MNHSDDIENPKPRPSPMAGIKRAIFALGILVIVLFVFGQIIPRLFLEPEPASPPVVQDSESESRLMAQQQSLQALEDRVNQLEAKLKTYEELLSAPKAEPETTASYAPDEAMKAWQASIEAKLALLEETKPAPATALDEPRLAALEARVNNQQESFATIQMQADEKITLTIALTQLRETLLRGDSFAAPLNTVASLSASRSDITPLIESLRTHANQGLTTPEESKAQFEPLIRRALERSGNDSLADNVRSLVSIRKVGEPEGSSDEAILARAETKLSRGDMQGSLDELKDLSVNTANVFAAWIANAQAYQSAASSLRALEIAAFKTSSSESQGLAP
ncbi:MAG: hypothetical protein LW823_07450 [Rickettsiales bacterium]|jgi:hypothetical protein|nr:hypothetical protein [Rickettsiales bacterium]